MTDNPQRIDAIRKDPDFQELVRTRTRFAWVLTAIMLVIYLGFIVLIAFDKEFLATPLGGGVTTIGIPIGVGVILSAFFLTGLYVARANSRFDALTHKITTRVGAKQ